MRLKVLHCRVKRMILAFRNIHFDKEGRERFVHSPETSCDGVKLQRTVEEADKVEQVLALVNSSINRL